MNTPKYQIQLTPEKTLEHLTTITTGLVASGQFLVDPELDDAYSISGAIAVAALGVLRELIANIEGEINEGDAGRYIDKGDARRNFLPGSDNDRRAAWLKNPVEKPYEPGSSED